MQDEPRKFLADGRKNICLGEYVIEQLNSSLDVDKGEILLVSLSKVQAVFHEVLDTPAGFSSFPFPTTRYQGSKAKLCDWIWEAVKDLKFDSVLDAFGGTGCVAHMFKRKGKRVVYNDLLVSNCITGKALIENSGVLLSQEDVDFILKCHDGVNYPTFIADTFQDIFYLDEENVWLDMVVTNIRMLDNEYKQVLAWYALFQACIVKRPYNLFHRANLYVRTAEVERSFGNKTTWDTPFEAHFRSFVVEANKSVFDNGSPCRSVNFDALTVPRNDHYDLVYIDTPYITAKGVGTDYLDFYHFLEGMVDYDNWPNRILREYKHLPLKGKGENPWTRKPEIVKAFHRLFERYKDSILVISYRNDGIPSEEQLVEIVRQYKKDVVDVQTTNYKYVLSTNSASKECLIIGK